MVGLARTWVVRTCVHRSVGRPPQQPSRKTIITINKYADANKHNNWSVRWTLVTGFIRTREYNMYNATIGIRNRWHNRFFHLIILFYFLPSQKTNRKPFEIKWQNHVTEVSTYNLNRYNVVSFFRHIQLHYLVVFLWSIEIHLRLISYNTVKDNLKKNHGRRA